MRRSLALAIVVLAACAPRPTAAPGALQAAETGIEVVSRRDVAPAGGDGAPRLGLVLVRAGGVRVPIEGEATHYALFRDGAAILRPDESLELVTASEPGTRTVLARRSGPPARDAEGALLYVARYDLDAELHRLSPSGEDRVLARGLVGIGLLSPQPDGRVLFVASVNGGVAGLFVADERGARCLTNCALRTGEPWGDALVPIPASAEPLSLEGDVARWIGASGESHSVALGGPR